MSPSFKPTTRYKQIGSGGANLCYEHIAVAERCLGRQLPTGAQVHHLDGNKHNNAPSNLVICQDLAYHKLLHVRQRVKDAGGDPNSERLCSRCRKCLPFSMFYKHRGDVSYGLQHMCRNCSKQRKLLGVSIPAPNEVDA